MISWRKSELLLWQNAMQLSRDTTILLCEFTVRRFHVTHVETGAPRRLHNHLGLAVSLDAEQKIRYAGSQQPTHPQNRETYQEGDRLRYKHISKLYID